MDRPSFIVSTSSVPEKDGTYPDSDERLSFGRAIGHAAGLQRIGLHVERVPPGRRTSHPHAERDEEEFVYVLEGTLDAWIDGHLHRMSAGDLAAFPAGTGDSPPPSSTTATATPCCSSAERSRPTNGIYYPLNPERRGQVPPESWWRRRLVRRRGRTMGGRGLAERRRPFDQRRQSCVR